jgi:7,8-dihydropterin-6-yl-methyl-4-(beta-D-ribofuranosyl)aminobenzene 5'-phosphate synthase
MPSIADFGATRDVAITILVDNRADLLLKSNDTVKYYRDEPLLAEHGFAALIYLREAGVRILWDAGMTAGTMMENMRRLKIDPRSIDKIALSHGHDDHSAGMTAVLQAMALQPQAKDWPATATMEEIGRHSIARRVPLAAHPAAFRERWSIQDDGRKHGPTFGPPRAEWEAVGAEVILSEGPYQLAEGCWTTGMVPRTGWEVAGLGKNRYYREGGAFHRDQLEDDQAIVIHLRDKGLLVISGCAHVGIMHTIRYAQQISGVERVWGVIGGFHLAAASDAEVQRTLAEMHSLRPSLIAPCHCTGAQAMGRFAAQMPEAFVWGAVGATFLEAGRA